MEGDGEQGRQATSEGWENRLAEETDEQKQALATHALSVYGQWRFKNSYIRETTTIFSPPLSTCDSRAK